VTSSRSGSKPTTSSSSRTSALLAVLVVVALYVFLWRPQAGQLGDAQDRRAAAETKLDRARSDLAATRGDDDQDAAGTNDAWRRAVPSTPELSALLRDLDALATQTGLRVDAISPSPPVPNVDAGGSSIAIVLTGQGSGDAAYGYLAGLRSLERLVVVEQVDLLDASTPDEADAAATVQVQFGLRAFVADASVAPTAEGDDRPAERTTSAD